MVDKKSIDNEVMLSKVAELIALGHTVTILVKGHSMNPFLRNGRDHVTLAPFKTSHLQPGVVVLAREKGSGRIVLHRIIHRKGDCLTLQGDGNVYGTEQTMAHLVMGQVTEMIRGTKHYAADGCIWRCYSCCWIRLKPVRRWLLAAYRLMFRDW